MDPSCPVAATRPGGSHRDEANFLFPRPGATQAARQTQCPTTRSAATVAYPAAARTYATDRCSAGNFELTLATPGLRPP